MQNTSQPARRGSAPRAGHTPRPLYRERLSPSLWILGGATVVAPMASLVFVQYDGTLSLLIGAAVGVAVVAAFILTSPVVEVVGGELRAGRAHIDVALLGEPTALSDEEARSARGPQLDPRGWHLIRGGVAGIVVLPNLDPDDPVSSWTLSSRTPDRLAAAVRHAQSAR